MPKHTQCANFLPVPLTQARWTEVHLFLVSAGGGNQILQILVFIAAAFLCLHLKGREGDRDGGERKGKRQETSRQRKREAKKKFCFPSCCSVSDI